MSLQLKLPLTVMSLKKPSHNSFSPASVPSDQPKENLPFSEGTRLPLTVTFPSPEGAGVFMERCSPEK